VKKLRRGVTDGTLPTALKYGPITGLYSSDKASACLHPAISGLSDLRAALLPKDVLAMYGADVRVCTANASSTSVSRSHSRQAPRPP